MTGRGVTGDDVTGDDGSPQLRLLLVSMVAIGPGKAMLLEAIERTGSISAAARSMKMSYRRAWTLVDTMNRCFREPLVQAGSGGRGGGGAAVTDMGHEVLSRYRAMETKARASVSADVLALTALMVKAPEE